MDEVQLEPGWLENEIKRTRDYMDNTTLSQHFQLERSVNPPLNVRERQPYLSIDLETTGLDSDWCQILEIGAVIEDWRSPVHELPVFHAFYCHEHIYGEPYALAMNAKILKKIADRKDLSDPNALFLHPSKVTKAFQKFLYDNGFVKGDNDKYKVTVAGKNFGSFDLQFLKRQGLRNIEFRHRFIDAGALFYNPAIDDVPPNTEECLRRAGMTPNVLHEAVPDAIDIIKLVRHVAGIRGEFGAMEVRRAL